MTRTRTIALYLGIWFAVIAFFAMQMQLSARFTWPQAFSHAIVHWSPWILAAPGVFWLARRFPFVNGNRWKSLFVHLIASVLCVFLVELIAFQFLAKALPNFNPGRERAEAPLDHGPPLQDRGPDASEKHRPPPRLHDGPPRRDQRLRDFSPPNEDRLLEHRGPPPRRHPPRYRPVHQFFFGAISRIHRWLPIYWTLVALQSFAMARRQMLDRERQALELKSRLAESRLDTLKLQLQPHFLFNSLNALATLIHKDPDKADDMVCQLSILLRGVLEEKESNEVPFSRELELLRAYLAIEKVRFGDNIQIIENIDPASLKIPVPVLLLQPIVENSIRHGIEPRRGSGTISISTQVRDGEMHLEIADDGIGPTQNSPRSGFGVGLSNAEARLETLYGSENFRITIGERDPNGTIVRIRIPYSTS